MHRFRLTGLSALIVGVGCYASATASWGAEAFQLKDVFELEWATDPQVSPDGSRIAYVRNFMDAKTDRRRANIWVVSRDGANHFPITSGTDNNSSPRWSPDGRAIFFVSSSGVSSSGGDSQIHAYWFEASRSAQLTRLAETPSGLTVSPQGDRLAFSMFTPAKRKPFIELPEKPPGAEWADDAKMIEKLRYRADGGGYLRDGFHHLYVIPVDGGTPRQVTAGDFHHQGAPSWTPAGDYLVFSANRRPDADYDPLNSDVYDVELASGEIRQLTKRHGGDDAPVVSPDGKWIAYVGFDDEKLSYHPEQLYLMKRDGTESRLLLQDFDRSVGQVAWVGGSAGPMFMFDDKGHTKIAVADMKGGWRKIADDVGGVSLGRPYSSGSYSAAENGIVAFTQTTPQRPADVAVALQPSGGVERITDLNGDLLAARALGAVEEIWLESQYDKLPIQAWIVKPPNFDPRRRYPLILEIHGGPYANYGSRFAAEMQLYAAAGYVVVYANPRGSTGYGRDFALEIHHNYPGRDYDDLMSAVDEVISRKYIDPQRLFVTGGSGGGVLTSWVVGKTNRFRAAVSAKPVINWYSFALTSDAYPYFSQYWFAKKPWEDPESYLRRSPLSLVGNVKTPTMVLTGEQDFRTPISESEQFYQALKLRKIDAALVRIPGASHAIASRPTQLMAKVAYILKWFEKHGRSD
ncbi:MAG: S9 family peptidase [Pirellulaceae bacterium]|nr:S9 family peptidase [Pirellulaceae bacterium]MDP7016513.1 S9 family peptidase [Pirellulaceae bacterium]